MYKKITHSIIEEHFDHPLASQIQKSVFKSGRPTTEILDETKFRADVRTYFNNYIEKNNSIVNSVTGSEDELIDAFESLFTTIDNFGNMTKPLYSSEFGERLNTSMRTLPILLMMMVHIRKIGQADQNLVFRLSNWASDVTSALTAFNGNLTWQTTNDLLAEYVTALQNKLEARLKKDAAKEAAADAIISAKIDSFSGFFSNTIVNQHPERFVRA